MYDYTCAYCGKVVQVMLFSQKQKFCSKPCSVSYARVFRGTTPKNNPTGGCIFQPDSINCFRMECGKCGWNPKVAQERLDAIKEKKHESTV